MERVKNTWDHHTDRRIMTLHPMIRSKAASFINHTKEKYNITLRITSALRDMEKQEQLYSIGRTTALDSRPVTNAKPGHSYHNYGLAFDVVEMRYGKPVWDSEYWELIGETGEEFGFEWGGRWESFQDRPHFQFSKGLPISKLLDMPVDDEGYPIVKPDDQIAANTKVQTEKRVCVYFDDYQISICLIKMTDGQCFVGYHHGRQNFGLALESAQQQIGDFYHAD